LQIPPRSRASCARTDTEGFLAAIGIDPAIFDRHILEAVTGRPARVADQTDAIYEYGNSGPFKFREAFIDSQIQFLS
jgi:hypothetical protein